MNSSEVKCLAKIVCKFQEQQIGEASWQSYLIDSGLLYQVLAKLSQQVLDGKAEVRLKLYWPSSS